MTLKIKNETDILSKLEQAVYVVGTQWGDEGKGKLVDILSAHYDIIARSAGGANAGHTICVNENGQTKKFIFHLLPSGILHEGKICVIGNGTVVHIPTMLEEIEMLRQNGISMHKRLLISDRAHLIFGYHKLIDEIQEQGKGDEKVGTTKRGIGPAYADKIERRGIRVCDLLDFDEFARKLRANAERHMKVYGFKFDIEKEINYYKDAVEIIQGYIGNTAEYVHKSYKEGKNLLIEGAQGTHLDIDHGTYPYVTSSNTTCGGACTGLGFPPGRIANVVGIMKAYTTRVGSGPFPTELADMEGEMLRDKGAEYGATTGRPRRCGWLDLIVVKNAVALNGITSINLTKLDVLSQFNTIKIGVGYTLDGEPIDYIPASLKDFERVKVKYIEMDGWTEDLSSAKKFSDLPKNCQKYVKTIEEVIETPINFIGVGMHRNEMIYR
ncbi:MAG: adenylosuccinate synthase [Candidatus Magasanikbacteria bacterium]|nr:adenylosuccinate synthase [Candidatus Magasanikbacteria bacterium]